MIDLVVETVFALSELPQHVPARRGRRIHISTGFRWASRGLRGIRLETVQCGGAKCTSVEALSRFFQRLTNPAADAETRTSAQRERAARKAEAELDAVGI